MNVLITGGAGFIRSPLADRLLAEGHDVRALDNLDEQVHGGNGRPEYLDPAVELHVGDVRDRAAVGRALDGVDAVYLFAAAVGVGQPERVWRAKGQDRELLFAADGEDHAGRGQDGQLRRRREQ